MKYITHFIRALEVLIYDYTNIMFYQSSVSLLRITVKFIQVLVNAEKCFFKEDLEITGTNNNSTMRALFINMQWVEFSDKVIRIQ